MSPPISSVRMMTGLPFIVSATDLYASNCSSSVGIVSLSMKRNSVRKSPIPSPSHSTAFFASSGFPILHTSSTFVPSADTVGTPANFFKSSFSFLYSSSSPANFCSVSASGFTIASPLVPLSTTLSPFLTDVQIPSILRTAGISIALASIAEWEVLPPTSVSIPAIFSATIPAVMDGVRSCATSTVPAGAAEIS